MKTADLKVGETYHVDHFHSGGIRGAAVVVETGVARSASRRSGGSVALYHSVEKTDGIRVRFLKGHAIEFGRTLDEDREEIVTARHIKRPLDAGEVEANLKRRQTNADRLRLESYAPRLRELLAIVSTTPEAMQALDTADRDSILEVLNATRSNA